MKYIFFLILSSYFAFSSIAQIELPINHYKKIIFKYETKPNFYFENEGIFADTFLLKKEFPRIKYILKKSPKDTLQNIGYLAKENMNTEEIIKLRSIIFHLYNQREFTYNVKSRKTKIKGSLCADAECKNIFKTFFKRNEFGTSIVPSTIEYYDERNIMIENRVSGSFETNYNSNLINWSNELETAGFYSEYSRDHDNSNKQFLYINAIIVNPELDKHINPIHLFKNCDFGVKKIISKYYTTTLVSVRYE